MRDIKFRGKRVDNGEWVYGFWGNRPDGANFICPFDNYDSYAVMPETVGQFISLCDADDVAIYDGDFIKHNDNTFEIKWSSNKFCYVARAYNTGMNWRDLEWVSRCKKYIKIAGNKFDNSELISNGKN